VVRLPVVLFSENDEEFVPDFDHVTPDNTAPAETSVSEGAVPTCALDVFGAKVVPEIVTIGIGLLELVKLLPDT
jgi:hypothetical protein